MLTNWLIPGIVSPKPPGRISTAPRPDAFCEKHRDTVESWRNGWVNQWDVPRRGVGYSDAKQKRNITVKVTPTAEGTLRLEIPGNEHLSGTNGIAFNTASYPPSMPTASGMQEPTFFLVAVSMD